MVRRSLIALATLLMIGGASIGLGPGRPTVASANVAANGQQILFTDTVGNTYHVCVSGYNQVGQYHWQCWYTPGYTTKLSGAWYNAYTSFILHPVYVYEYGLSWNYLRYTVTYPNGWDPRLCDQIYSRNPNGGAQTNPVNC